MDSGVKQYMYSGALFLNVFFLAGHLSFWYLGDEELLIHEFEIVHFLIFFVMVFFVSAVLVILQVRLKKIYSITPLFTDFCGPSSA